ncbi:hypothetical protein C2W62_53740, partial [Candidatus Entotheonella serta]
APLVRAQLPSRPPAVKMSQAHPRPNPMLSCFGEQVSAGAIGGGLGHMKVDTFGKKFLPTLLAMK